MTEERGPLKDCRLPFQGFGQSLSTDSSRSAIARNGPRPGLNHAGLQLAITALAYVVDQHVPATTSPYGPPKEYGGLGKSQATSQEGIRLTIADAANRRTLT